MELALLVGTGEAHPEHVLVDAHFRNQRFALRQPNLEEEALAPAERELVHAVFGRAFAFRDGAADVIQNQSDRLLDGAHQPHPLLELGAADVVGQRKPVVEHRHVEAAGSAGNRLARADELQPLVVADALPGAPDRASDFLRDSGECFKRGVDVGRSARGAFRRLKREPLAVELLQKLVLEVGPRGCVRQVEDGRERRVVRNAGILSAEPVELTEKMLQTQVHANFLVAGKFVEDESCRVHSLFNSKERKRVRRRVKRPLNPTILAGGVISGKRKSRRFVHLNLLPGKLSLETTAVAVARISLPKN